MSEDTSHQHGVLDRESGMMRFEPIDRRTGERLNMEIPYRDFPHLLEHLAVIIHPATKDRLRIFGKECSTPGCNCDAFVELIDDSSMSDFFPHPELDWWSMQIEYADDVSGQIAQYEREYPEDASIFFIHGRLWETRNRTMTRAERDFDMRSELHPALQQAERGEGTPLEEAMQKIRRELPERLAKLEQVETGNLALPEKLYAFVLEQVDSGTFSSASEFVNEAIRSPKAAAARTLSGLWEHVIADNRTSKR